MSMKSSSMPSRRAASIASLRASGLQRQTGMSPRPRTHFQTKLDCWGSASRIATRRPAMRAITATLDRSGTFLLGAALPAKGLTGGVSTEAAPCGPTKRGVVGLSLLVNKLAPHWFEDVREYGGAPPRDLRPKARDLHRRVDRPPAATRRTHPDARIDMPPCRNPPARNLPHDAAWIEAKVVDRMRCTLCDRIFRDWKYFCARSIAVAQGCGANIVTSDSLLHHPCIADATNEVSDHGRKFRATRAAPNKSS